MSSFVSSASMLCTTASMHRSKGRSESFRLHVCLARTRTGEVCDVHGRINDVPDDVTTSPAWHTSCRTPLSGKVHVHWPLDITLRMRRLQMEAQVRYEEQRDLEHAREDTAVSALPVLVNTDAEVRRMALEIPTYEHRYPLLRVERKDAPVLLLLAYLFRLIVWRLFFSKKLAEIECE